MKPIEKILLCTLLEKLREMALKRAIAQRWVSFEITLEVITAGHVVRVTFARTHQHTTVIIDREAPIAWRSGFPPDELVKMFKQKFLAPSVPIFPEVAV